MGWTPARTLTPPATARPASTAAALPLSPPTARDVNLASALVDVLRSFGLDEEGRSDALREGVSFLLHSQRADGSWRTTAAHSPQAYHATCSALLALSPHEHHGFGPAVPRLLRLLRRQAGLDLKEEL